MPATTSNDVIDVKKAMEIASRHLRELIFKISPSDIGLEEAELQGSHWEITLSFTDPRKKELSSIFQGDRIYKKFGVDRSTGEVLFMRIRKP